MMKIPIEFLMLKLSLFFFLLTTGFLIYGQKSQRTDNLPTVSLLEGKWQHNYDSTNYIIFHRHQCSEIQNGDSLYSESFEVYDGKPYDNGYHVNTNAKRNQFGKYLWFDTKAVKNPSIAPIWIEVKFKTCDSLQLGILDSRGASCLGDQFGYAEYHRTK